MEMLGIVARNAIEKQPPAWLNRVIEILHDGFAESLTTTQIAAEVGVHPFHLSRVFRRFYRQSLGEYANRLRVEAACRRMSEPNVRLADIAIGVGFADQSHFNRIFKQITGMTPGAFRANTANRS
jgi:AraC family transcriptional regulator